MQRRAEVAGLEAGELGQRALQEGAHDGLAVVPNVGCVFGSFSGWDWGCVLS